MTGTTSGLSLATAKAFAEAGAAVAKSDWNEEEVKATAEKMAVKEHNTLAIRCDVSDDKQVEDMVKKTVASLAALTTPITMPVFKMSWRKPLIKLWKILPVLTVSTTRVFGAP